VDANDQDVTAEMGVDVFRAAAKVVLRETTDAIGDDGLDFSLQSTSLSCSLHVLYDSAGPIER
jgi:hypothetical protein